MKARKIKGRKKDADQQGKQLDFRLAVIKKLESGQI
jgi:hypothetical protein